MSTYDKRLKAIEERVRRGFGGSWMPRLILIAPDELGSVRVRINEWDGKTTIPPDNIHKRTRTEEFESVEDAEIFTTIFVEEYEKRLFGNPLRVFKNELKIINICR